MPMCFVFNLRLFPCLLFVALMIACSAKKTPADLILRGGKIYTLNEQTPVVEAVVVIADTIAYAGDLAGSNAFEGENTKVIDLGGRTMTPGFIESHGHLMALGHSELELNLDHVKSYEELVDKVKSAVAGARPGEWIRGRGWHQDKWSKKPPILVKGFQTHPLLSAVSPNNPVFLEHASGHAVFVNAKAMQIAGIHPLSIEKVSRDAVEGGEVIRDQLGNPTGILIDRAVGLVAHYIPKPSEETDTKALELAIAACLRNGITEFHDAGASGRTIALYEKFKSEGKLATRLYVMLDAQDNKLREWYQRGPEIDSTHWLTIRSIKLHCDGALGTRSAWLLEPYSDRSDFYGMATISMDTVLKTCRDALQFGFQVCSHAIGDRTNKEVLNRYETAFKGNLIKSRDARFRIEHAQHLYPDDIPRFGRLGVIASMQAIHLSSDRPWAIDRLGKKRIEEGAYCWQSLLRTGAKVINGTDVPVEPINPVACFYSSVTRKTLTGEPEGGYEPKEKMTRQQALRSYTLDAAYGAFEEKIKGSIEPGKLADFTIFSQDIMSVPEKELLKTEVVMTIVGGKVEFEKK
jgi:predicted amidohydrolase YtcJ